MGPLRRCDVKHACFKHGSGIYMHSVRNKRYAGILMKYCSWRVIHVLLSLTWNVKWVLVCFVCCLLRKERSLIWLQYDKVWTFFRWLRSVLGKEEFGLHTEYPWGKMKCLRDWDAQLDNTEIDPLSWNMEWKLGKAFASVFDWLLNLEQVFCRA